MGELLDNALAVLNGAAGDYLVRTNNGLALEMALIHGGRALPLRRDALKQAHPDAGGRVVVLVHGLMCTETIWRMPDGTDYGSRLRDDLGYTPYYVRYNSGLPIADNGVAFHRLLEQLADQTPQPITDLLLVGYSMGGLVVRSACHVASAQGSRWLPLVKNAIYVGTPHRGAPAERWGRVIQRVLNVIDDPYTKLIAEIASMRSAGIQDLGDSDLTHEDRARRVTSVKLRDAEHPVPLLPSIHHHLIAGTFAPDPTLAELFGDMVVPLSSATNQSDADVRVYPGLTHIDVPHSPQVYEQIKAWCQAMHSEDKP